MSTRVLILSKSDNIFCDYAEAILFSYFEKSEVVAVRGLVGDTLNVNLYHCNPDYIISFLSPWIIPANLLMTANIASINFHPGPPEYPGTGCYNFAIYEQAVEYGVTCHYMEAAVDSGVIIRADYFSIAPNESIESLKLKAMNQMLLVFRDFVEQIYYNKEIKTATEKWKRKAFTRKQLEELCRIDPLNDNEKEIELKIRATYYPGKKGPYIDFGDSRFVIEESGRKPIV